MAPLHETSFVARLLTSLLVSTVLKYSSANSDAPQQIHIAAASRSSFRVSWKTQTVTPSHCSFGDTEENLSMQATGDDGYQYIADHGYHHSVLLNNLPLDSVYFYSCGDGTPENTSPVFKFKTAPSPSKTVKLSILGDWGYLDSVQRPMDLPVDGLERNWTAVLTRELLETFKDTEAMDAFWIVGDIGYVDDAFGHKNYTFHEGYEPCYDGFMQWQQNYSSIMPLMVSPGNHESECHDPYCILHLDTVGLSLNNFSAYNARFSMPSPESNGVLNMWYSWNWGPVHITSLNTETDFEGAEEEFTGDSHFDFLPAGGFAPNGTYLAWLESDLAAAAADPDVKWIIAGGHRPFESLPDAHVAQLTQLFLKYNVSMYFAGHGHTYNRYNASTWNDGTVHIMAGASGSDETAYPEDQFADSLQGFKEFGKPAGQACEEWCQLDVVRELHRLNGHDPCFHCHVKGSGVGTNRPPDPMYFTDKMSAGILTASETELSWSLYRAPDGLLLDTVTLIK